MRFCWHRWKEFDKNIKHNRSYFINYIFRKCNKCNKMQWFDFGLGYDWVNCSTKLKTLYFQQHINKNDKYKLKKLLEKI